MRATSKPGAVGVVLAAGMGTRIGADGNKAYLRLAGRSMVSWSVDAVTRTPGIDRSVLVFRRGERELVTRTITTELPSATVEFVEGGDSRHDSEWNVLRYLADDVDSGSIDIVLIHDAARPLAGPDMMGVAVSVAREFGGAIPAVPAHDPVRITADGITATGPLVRVQTPQAFRAKALLDAYRWADGEGFEGTDTSSCVERFTDLDVRVFAGPATNFKVTYAPDVLVAARLLHDRVSDDSR